MGTSTGFVPASVVECPYAPRMTRAAAIALRAAGGLKENCVVVITDGPVIGVPGFTSPTEIELQPTSASEFGLDALVHTTFDNTPWSGLFDIDLGAAGSIIRLTDSRNNTAFDTDANSPTVHSQVPWGQGTLLQFRDNTFEDATMTWALPFTAGFNFTDNVVADATLDFTGLTTNFHNVNGSEFRTAKAVFAGTSTGSTTVSRVKVTGIVGSTAYLTVAPTGNGGCTMSDSEIRAGFTVSASNPSGSVSIIDSVLKGNTGVATFAAACTVSDSTVIFGNINIQTGTTGNNSISRSTLVGTAVTKTTGCTAPLAIQGCWIDDQSTLTLGANNKGTTNSLTDVRGRILFNLLGPVAAPGRNDFTNGIYNTVSVNVAATATAGINISGGTHDGSTFNQNRSAGTASTNYFTCETRGLATMTDAGTTDPTVALSINRCDFTDCSINIGNIAAKSGAGTILQQCRIVGSTLNISGLAALAFLSRLWMLGATLTNNGFACDNVSIQSSLVKAFTAINNNKMANVAFDNVV